VKGIKGAELRRALASESAGFGRLHRALGSAGIKLRIMKKARSLPAHCLYRIHVVLGTNMNIAFLAWKKLPQSEESHTLRKRELVLTSLFFDNCGQPGRYRCPAVDHIPYLAARPTPDRDW
jgi:hypothetical protein